MKKKILVLSLCSFLLAANAQENLLASTYLISTSTISKAHTFPGGKEAMQKHIQANLNYPELAKEQGVEGEVILLVQMHENGKVKSAKVEKGIGFGCDEEALRLILSMPDWEPAAYQGDRISSEMQISVVFRLR